MPYKITGNLEQDSRIIVLNDTTGALITSETVSAGTYEIEDLSGGRKIVLARNLSTGEVNGYGYVEPTYYDPVVTTTFYTTINTDTGYGFNQGVYHNTYVQMGSSGQGSSNRYDYNGYILFHNVNIPKNATIQSAYVRMKLEMTSANIPDVRVLAHDVINSTYPTDIKHLEHADTIYTPRWEVTAERQLWYPEVVGVNSIVDTPDIANVIQYMVNRSDWNEGTLCIVFLGAYNGSGLHWRRFYRHTDYPSELHVTYISA
jgi:hypothetical protein